MAKRLLSGGEAIAQAALEAGASVIAGYPTDSVSRLIESALRQTLKRNASGAHAQWTVNDKTTLGICAAASTSGFRCLAAFGQTGFSEVVQGITALSYAGIKGGLVVVVADEPSSDAFTANLDVRRICELAKIPIMDPATSTDAYNCVSAAFVLSERYSMPVVIHVSQDIDFSSAFFDIQSHTKAAARKGTFMENRKSLDVADLINEESQEGIDFTNESISDTDARLKEIAYKFSYKDTYAVYNRIYEFEQQYEGKHNSKRFASRDEEDDYPPSATDIRTGAASVHLDESNIKIGICVCGSCAPYAIEAIETLRREAHKSKVSTPYIRLLALGTPFPIPKRTLRRFLEGLNDILVIEEFSSFAEEELVKQCATNFLGPNVHGRFTDEVNYNYPVSFESMIMHIAAFIDKLLNVRPDKGFFTDTTEPDLSPVLNLGKHSSPPDSAKTLTPKQSRTLTGIARRLANPESIYTYNSDIPDRPPVLCSGCPHRASFYTITRALERLKISRDEIVISADVGCELLGNNPPLNFMDAYMGKGFSASLAQGFSLSLPPGFQDGKCIALLGDSSFFSTAIPSISNAVVNDIDITIVILDNETCAESGLQPTPASNGRTDIAEVLHSLGVHNVRVADPFEINNAVDACIKALRDTRPSAVVLTSKCARLIRSKKVTYINTNKCTGCRECITQLGCPAIFFDKDIKGRKSGDAGQAVIDINQCNGCRLCIHVCPSEAIRTMMHKDVAELMRQERSRLAEQLEDAANIDSDTADIEEGAADEINDMTEDMLDSAGLSFASGSLMLEETDSDDVAEEEEQRPKRHRRTSTAKIRKKTTQAEFGTLFGGKNAELRLNFEDEDSTKEDQDAKDAIEDDIEKTENDTEIQETLEEDAIEADDAESHAVDDPEISADAEDTETEDEASKEAADTDDAVDAVDDTADESDSDAK